MGAEICRVRGAMGRLSQPYTLQQLEEAGALLAGLSQWWRRGLEVDR